MPNKGRQKRVLTRYHITTISRIVFVTVSRVSEIWNTNMCICMYTSPAYWCNYEYMSKYVAYERMLMATPTSMSAYIEKSSYTDKWGWVCAWTCIQVHVLVWYQVYVNLWKRIYHLNLKWNLNNSSGYMHRYAFHDVSVQRWFFNWVAFLCSILCVYFIVLLFVSCLG